mgnify:CR=1 FL=1
MRTKTTIYEIKKKKKQNQLIYDYQQQISFNFRVKNQDKNIFQSRKSTYNKF